jgi:hypothetical protein
MPYNKITKEDERGHRENTKQDTHPAILYDKYHKLKGRLLHLPVASVSYKFLLNLAVDS